MISTYGVAIEDIINSNALNIKIISKEAKETLNIVKEKENINYQLVRKRLIESRKKAGMTQEELTDNLNMHKISLARFECGSTKTIKISHLKDIAEVLNIDYNWLIGKDEEIYDNKERDNICAPTKGFLQEVPIYKSVSAGLGITAVDDIIDYIPTIISNRYESKATFAIQVIGDSMIPDICDGDIVVVHKQDMIESGQVGVVLIDNTDGYVKKIRYSDDYIELVSLNKKYKPMHFEKQEMNRVRIVGLVKSIIKPYN